MLFRSVVSSIPKRSLKVLRLANFQSFNFSSAKESLKTKLEEQIKYESENKASVTEYINFFNNNGWDVQSTGTQVELTKKNNDYTIHVLFSARNPSTEDPEDEQQQQQGEEDQGLDNYDDYAEVSVYVLKNGQSKLMVAEFAVTQEASEMINVRFVEDYEKERNDRIGQRQVSTRYTGPEIHSLEPAIVDKLGEFIEVLGVDHSFLQNASRYSLAFEHQFYLEWLKDIKSIL